jgi:regulator of cell morphogenesis and NO signaling
MELTPDTKIATLVREMPASIAVLQKYGMAFCCTGATPLAAACAHHNVSPEHVLADIERTLNRRVPSMASDAGMPHIIDTIQKYYHQPLREELPRISALLAKLVLRHGERLPDVLPPLKHTFERLRTELEQHIAKEDQGLFPALINLAVGTPGSNAARHWIHNPIGILEAEHDEATVAMRHMRRLTDNFTPPEDACPTFRGVYYALAELERDLSAHVRLEQEMLFPRALAYATNLEPQS